MTIMKIKCDILRIQIQVDLVGAKTEVDELSQSTLCAVPSGETDIAPTPVVFPSHGGLPEKRGFWRQTWAQMQVSSMLGLCPWESQEASVKEKARLRQARHLAAWL